jgi:hypothetical protein
VSEHADPCLTFGPFLAPLSWLVCHRDLHVELEQAQVVLACRAHLVMQSGATPFRFGGELSAVVGLNLGDDLVRRFQSRIFGAAGYGPLRVS